MAKGSKSESAAAQLKKKKWFKIVAPEMFDNMELGETLLEEVEHLMDRSITTNLMHLTRDLKKQNVNMKFKVVDIKDNAGHTKAVSYVMSPASVKRLVRAGRDRIDDSFVVTTSDGIHVRIKPMIVSKDNLNARQRTMMRKISQDTVLAFIEGNTYDAIIKAILDGALIKEIKAKVGKVAPVRNVDIRAFEVQQTINSKGYAKKYALPEMTVDVTPEEEAVSKTE